MKQVPIGVSARHIHLSKVHMDALFGQDYELKVLRPLSQPGQFAAAEVVAVRGPKGYFENVRILGPARGNTQLEVSRTDGFALGIHPPVRESGSIDATPGIHIQGPSGDIMLEHGVIVAARHIHFHTSDAEKWGIQDKQLLRVKVNGERSLIFEHVLARISPFFTLEMHIDTDEGNAAGAKTGDWGEIIG